MPSETMTRAEALKMLIAVVRTGEPLFNVSRATIRLGLGLIEGPHLFWNVVRSDDLNAVARLEAPLRERGWRGPQIDPPLADGQEWVVKWFRDEWLRTLSPFSGRSYHQPVTGEAVAEPRARLLACLKAMLHEQETGE